MYNTDVAFYKMTFFFVKVQHNTDGKKGTGPTWRALLFLCWAGTAQKALLSWLKNFSFNLNFIHMFNFNTLFAGKQINTTV